MERDQKGRFGEGNKPWNKGLKYSNSRKGKPRIGGTGFQKGHPNYHKKGNLWKMESKIKFSATQQGIDVKDWKEFKSDLNRRLRNTAKYQIWRNAVFLRDDFTCQNPYCKFCNNKIGIFIHAHHIQSIAEFPELMFNIDNGITYCEEFHLRGNLHEGIAKKQLNFIGGKR